MSASDVVDFLSVLVSGYAEDAECFTDDVLSVKFFREAGLLTRDDGLVVRMRDGSEFQIAVKQSR